MEYNRLVVGKNEIIRNCTLKMDGPSIMESYSMPGTVHLLATRLTVGRIIILMYDWRD